LRYLDEFPDAGVGEIGLDRWIQNPDMPAQEEVFRSQLDIAASQDRPASIHCLRAWGLLEQTLRSAALPRCGFLLHSYGGPAEMVPQFASLGAYFSLSPYFTHERKSRQAQTFAAVPLDRLLAESDAPDMWPPDELNAHLLRDSEGKPLNHPCNLQLSYRKLAEIRGMPIEELAQQIEQNFVRLFARRS
jgi:TatD DNase family protein